MQRPHQALEDRQHLPLVGGVTDTVGSKRNDLAVLRKIACHPLLVRSRYSHAAVLCMAARLFEDAFPGKAPRSTLAPHEPSGAVQRLPDTGMAPTKAELTVWSEGLKVRKTPEWQGLGDSSFAAL